MGISIRTSSLLTSAALSAGVLFASTASAQLTVFMDGLANPRGLTFQGNTLYVAEAGNGGTLSVYTGGDNEAKFYGTSGAISRKTIGGAQEDYLVGLPSAAGVAGFAATGPHDVGFDTTGRLNITIGVGANPNVRQTEPLQSQPRGAWLGTILRQETDLSLSSSVDVAALEAATDFDGAGADSNPFGLGITAGNVRVVADAGANTITAIDTAGGTRSVVLPAQPNPLFPGFGPPTYQAVPNGLTIGPDGDAYVTQLTGFPFPAGAASIYRIDLDAAVLTAEPVATGFTNLIDLAFGADGTLYALETDSDRLIGPGEVGTLYRVNLDGTSSAMLSNIANPTGLAVGPDGAWYVSATGLSPTEGQVLRFVPEPATLAVFAMATPLLMRRRK